MRIAHDRTVRGRRLAREEANSASGGEGNFVIATECRLSPDSGPSRGDPCRPAIRPIATCTARYGMSASRRFATSPRRLNCARSGHSWLALQTRQIGPEGDIRAAAQLSAAVPL